MAGKNTAVFGIYSQKSNLESALNELKVAGFRHEDISVLFPDNLGSKELATVKTTKAPEGATAVYSGTSKDTRTCDCAPRL